jgi:uncharacterized membrane protein
MSALSNDEIIHNSYTFESNRSYSEHELIQSYQEFHLGYTNIGVVSFTEVGNEEVVDTF